MSRKAKGSKKEESLGWIGELDRIEMRFLADFRRRMRAAGLQNRDLERRLHIGSATSSGFLLGRRGLTFRGAYRYCKAAGLEFVPYPGIVCRKSDGAIPAVPRKVSRRQTHQLPGLKKARRRTRHNKQRSYTYEIKYFRSRASFDPVAYYLQRVVTQLKTQRVNKSELARRLGVSRPYVLTYTRQLKLAELREARINIRQDRICPPHLLGEVKIGRQKEARRFLFSYT